MANKHNINESEWKILEVLWRHPDSMMADIVAAWQDTVWRRLHKRASNRGISSREVSN